MPQRKFLNPLSAISPLDGRYQERLLELSSFVSEGALVKTRIEIEIKYLIALSDFGILRRLTSKEQNILKRIPQNFNERDVIRIKEIEQIIRHDAKAVERFLRETFTRTSLKDLIEMIHFGLTSEDVNNLCHRLMLTRATQNVGIPVLKKLISELSRQAKKYKQIPMLGRTHGQPAIPTTVGKELVNFAVRLNTQLKKLQEVTLKGKLNGAVGNFNALVYAFPKKDWLTFSNNFVKSLGLIPNSFTTQINPYEDMIEFLQILQRINGIIVDLNQDMWRYISDEWFVQKARKGEVGSSTMPQKVNPIDFENSEGNIQLANGIIEVLTRELPISRLQRDLSDSTLLRNLGVVLGHSLLGYKSTLVGLSRIQPNKAKIAEDLMKNWAILSEGVQTLLRKYNIKDAYTSVSSSTKGRIITESGWKKWIEELDVENTVKKELKKLTPISYVGYAERLTDLAISEFQK